MNALKSHHADCKVSSKNFMLNDYQSAKSKFFPHFCRCCRRRCRYMHPFDMSSFVCVCVCVRSYSSDVIMEALILHTLEEFL